MSLQTRPNVREADINANWLENTAVHRFYRYRVLCSRRTKKGAGCISSEGNSLVTTEDAED